MWDEVHVDQNWNVASQKWYAPCQNQYVVAQKRAEVAPTWDVVLVVTL